MIGRWVDRLKDEKETKECNVRRGVKCETRRSDMDGRERGWIVGEMGKDLNGGVGHVPKGLKGDLVMQ